LQANKPLVKTKKSLSGELAEWLRSGLQNRVHRFNSGTRLQSL
jgi:hypothetical protein